MKYKEIADIRERAETFATLYKSGRATSEDLTKRAFEAHNDVLALLLYYPDVSTVRTSTEVAKLMGKPDDGN